jgi:hypothetical protein
MKALNIHTQLVDSCLGPLKNLSSKDKLDLIAKLTQSIKSDMNAKNDAFEQAFGAWDSEENADELVNRIKSSRQFNRQIEEL